MKNKEKYADEILENFSNSTSCQFKRKYVLKETNCSLIDCNDCNKQTKQWLEAECEPPKTRQSEFLKLFPNASTRSNGSLDMCPMYSNKDFECPGLLNDLPCEDCCQDYWSEEIE